MLFFINGAFRETLFKSDPLVVITLILNFTCYMLIAMVEVMNTNSMWKKIQMIEIKQIGTCILFSIMHIMFSAS